MDGGGGGEGGFMYISFMHNFHPSSILRVLKCRRRNFHAGQPHAILCSIRCNVSSPVEVLHLPHTFSFIMHFLRAAYE